MQPLAKRLATQTYPGYTKGKFFARPPFDPGEGVTCRLVTLVAFREASELRWCPACSFPSSS